MAKKQQRKEKLKNIKRTQKKNRAKNKMRESNDVINSNIANVMVNGEDGYLLPNGDRFVGQLKDGRFHGYGELYYATGQKYEGEFYYGKRHGNGIFYDALSGVYDGQWQNDIKSGKGTMMHINGQVYIGDFKYNCYNGKGIYKWPDGCIYEGDFKNDQMTGECIYKWPDGTRYIGGYKNGKKHGIGTMYYNDGEIVTSRYYNESIVEIIKKENVTEMKQKTAENNVNQSERLYVIDLIKKSIGICNKNINKTISSEELMEDEYFGEIYEEIINIAEDESWFLKHKNPGINNISNELNDIERSLIFMEFDALYFRSISLQKIRGYNWKIIRNGFVILLYQMIHGVLNKEVNKIKVKLREDGSIIDIIISYGKPIIRKGDFDPEKICEKMFFYKTWSGVLYSKEDKLIKETSNFMEICEELDLSLKINDLEDVLLIEENTISECENYVELLERSIRLKRVGNYEEAKNCLIKAIKIDQTMPTAYYNLGKLLYILEDFEASVNSYIAAYKRDIIGFMQNTPIAMSKFYLNLGHSLFDAEYLCGTKYSDVINEYRMGIKGEFTMPIEKSLLQDEYERLIIRKANDFLQELN